MIEDAELLRRYAEEKSEEAFAELVQRRIGLVYSVALRHTHHAHRAEDVTQAVFTALARKAASLARRPVLVGWLHRSAQFAASDAVRAEVRRQAREQEAHTMQQLAHAAPEPDWEKLRPVLDEVLNDLDERDRDAILLRCLDGRPFAEIGAKLRLTENAARMRVERALEKLRAGLARRGVTSTSVAVAVALASQAGVAAPAGLAATVTGTALADAAGATVLGFFQLMSTTKFAAGAAAVLAILALGTAGYKLQARHSAETALTAASQNYAALAARLREAQSRATRAEQQTAELKMNVDAAEAKAAADAAWNPVTEGKAFLQRHPELVSAMVDYHNAKIDLWNDRLYKSRGLTSAQIEEFRSLQRSRPGSNMWWNTKIDGNRIEMSPDEFGAMPRLEASSRLRALLGRDGMAELVTYFGPAPSQAVAATVEVSKDLCLTETPLTPSQADGLVDLFLTAFRAAGGIRSIAVGNPNWNGVDALPKGTSVVGSRVVASNVNWNGIDAGARQILSEAQLSGWETAFRRTRASMGVTEATAANSAPAK